MAQKPNEYLARSLLGALFVAGLLATAPLPRLALPYAAYGSVDGQFEQGTVLFVGDIMLGRAVERLMTERGREYPFLGIGAFVSKADVAVGNFEAAIPVSPYATPDFGMRLAAKENTPEVLALSGFDILGLANNHALDFGERGFLNTKSKIAESGVTPVGDPRSVTQFSTAVTLAGSTRIGVLAIHATTKFPSEAEVVLALEALEATSDIRVVYIHWGEEYERAHSAAQESFAELLIDQGADAVIGHHPHVTEDIGIYKGKPIFYSLGNLIFDQYFDQEVMEGLMVTLHILPDSLSYALVPIESATARSQPNLLPVDAQNEAIEALFARSEGLEAVRNGNTIVIPR